MKNQLLTSIVAVSFLSSSVASLFAAEFKEQVDELRKAGTSAPEAMVHAVLKQGLQEQRAAEAVVATRPWLQANQVKNLEVLYYAGASAELAGASKDAITYYRKLLANPDADSAMVAKAGMSFYRLLITYMKDVDGAYLFMRQHGNRLRSHGRLWKYDEWFLNEAHKRGDLAANLERLAAIFDVQNAAMSAAQDDLVRALSILETFNHAKTEEVSAMQSLARAKYITPVQKARILWVAEVAPLNLKVSALVDAKKEVPATLYSKAIAAASELVQVDPYEGSRLVARGWCHFPDTHIPSIMAKAVLHQDLKSPALFNALSTLPANQVSSVLSTRESEGVHVGIVLDPAAVQRLVAQKPSAFNALNGPDLAYYTSGMTEAAAQSIAPHLAKNPYPHAAIVRAVSKGHTTFTKAATYISQNEMWRFDEAYVKGGGLSRFLWDSGLERDGDFRRIDDLLKKSVYPSAAVKKAGAQAALAEVQAAQRELIQDLLSAAPQGNCSLGFFDQFANKGGDQAKANLLAMLTSATLSGDREALFYRALNNMRFGRDNAVRDLASANIDSGFLEKSHEAAVKAGATLAPHLQKLLTQQMQSGTIHEGMLGLWIRCVDPKNGQPFMKQLVASPAWQKVDPAYLSLAQHKDYFGATLGGAGNGADSVSPELLALPDKPSADQVKAALSAGINRAAAAPGFPALEGLEKAITQMSACEPYAKAVLDDFAPLDLDNKYGEYRKFSDAYVQHLLRTKNFQTAQTVAPSLWSVSWFHWKQHWTQNVYKNLIALTQAAYDSGDVHTASGLAAWGLHEHRKEESLKHIFEKTMEAMGAVSIPVQEGAAGYAIFLSQKEFMLDNEDAAWALYDEHAEELPPILQQLRLDYCFWLLERNVEKGEVGRVEQLVQGLTVWDRRGDASLSLEQQAVLRLAFAEVAFMKGAYGVARAWYQKVTDNQDYSGSKQQYRAMLGIVAIDREEKNYSDALKVLDRLILVKDDDLRIQVRYARALIYFAQEKYAEAEREIEIILQNNSNHANALLLQGKVQVAKRDLVSPSKIRIGIERSTKAIEPGKRIEIDLKDPSLSIAGEGMVIEVEARAASGDVERMTLRAVDEKRSVYRAEVKTELGASRPGDKVLQVLGRDTITYGFSKRFRESMKDLPADPEESVMIASDFELDISAGDFPKREGEREFTMEDLGLSTGDQALGLSRVRPGNPIYIRVTDPDQSRTANVDSVLVEVRSSSGDSINQFVLQETGPFTGVFEGVVPTAGGQAVAYAYDSEPGRDPNMVISPRADYPAWQGRQTTKTWRKFFSVDLKDVAALNDMTVVSHETGRLTKFSVQISSGNKSWDTVGCYPENPNRMFDGHPFFSLYKPGRDDPGIPGVQKGRVPEDWHDLLAFDHEVFSGTVKNIDQVTVPIAGKHHRNISALFKFTAYFYQPSVQHRRFKVSFPDDAKFRGLFLINGAGGEGDVDPTLIERELNPGLHKIEVWCQGTIQDALSLKLFCDDGSEEMVACPDAMFDPAGFPPAVRDSIRGLATIRESGTGSYTVNFGKNSTAQLVRILVEEHTGAAPALSKLELRARDGKQLLPVAEDYMTLRANQQLEVLPGDKITVKYVDDLTYSEKRSQQEKQLSVAYNNGSISAAKITFREGRYGGREMVLDPFRRFKINDDLVFVITDLDMDVSDERDAVPFSVKTSDGKSHDYKAYESESHSGVFVGKIFPIEGTPQRDSEIHISPGGTLTATYRDMENLDPGVPAYRSVTVEHAKYMTPEFGVYTASVEPVPFEGLYADEEKAKGAQRSSDEVIIPRLRIKRSLLPSDQLKTQKAKAIYHDSISFSVRATHLALGYSSRIHAYVQTESGRQAYAAMRKKAAEAGEKMPAPVTPFDVNVPGTLKVTGSIGGGKLGESPPGYLAEVVGQNTRMRKSERMGNSLDRGEFGFAVPIRPDDVPLLSYANQSAEGLADLPKSLSVRPGDIIYIGYPYFDEAGKVQWYTASATLSGDVFLDVMDGEYRYHLRNRFVGEQAYIRVIAPTLDKTSDRDEVIVHLKAQSGAEIPFTIRETFGNTGVFKGHFKLGILDQPGVPLTQEEFFGRGLPVLYSDVVTVSLPNAYPDSFSFQINNGADGLIESFSKQYSDNAVALQANFTLAECYFELAKMHRSMGEADPDGGQKMVSLSRREMAHAKKLLQEALATYQDPEQQAHAEYLLGNLSQEYADTSKNEALKKDNYIDALARFSTIPIDFPDSPFAPKAQYKRALVYEKMGELEIATEEYVKLGYKYPDNEHIPEAMSRIGGYFQKRGIASKKQADELMGKGDDESLKMSGELMESARRDFKWAATVFLRMMDRYPQHPLAGLAGVRAGQNRMRYGDYHGAIEAFEKVFTNAGYDGPDERAQALYFAGLSYEKIRANLEWGQAIPNYQAILHYEVTRYKFPASKWAKYARGRLATDMNTLTKLQRYNKETDMAELMARVP